MILLWASIDVSVVNVKVFVYIFRTFLRAKSTNRGAVNSGTGRKAVVVVAVEIFFTMNSYTDTLYQLLVLR